MRKAIVLPVSLRFSGSLMKVEAKFLLLDSKDQDLYRISDFYLGGNLLVILRHYDNCTEKAK